MSEVRIGASSETPQPRSSIAPFGAFVQWVSLTAGGIATGQASATPSGGATIGIETVPKEKLDVQVERISGGPGADEGLAECMGWVALSEGSRVLRDAWLAPLTLDRKSHGPMASKDGLRASDKGFLDISLEDYLKLLVWTGSQKRSDKKGFIPGDYSPIFQRVGIDAGMWCDLVWDFKKYFGRSRGAGSPDRMREMAASGGRSFQPGQKRAQKCFVQDDLTLFRRASPSRSVGF